VRPASRVVVRRVSFMVSIKRKFDIVVKYAGASSMLLRMLISGLALRVLVLLDGNWRL